MISSETVILVMQAIASGESEVRYVDHPWSDQCGDTWFVLIGGLFDRWRIQFFNDAGELDYATSVQSVTNEVGGFDDWIQGEAVNPVDELTLGEYRTLEAKLQQARKFVGYE